MRGATAAPSRQSSRKDDFNPRSSYEERLGCFSHFVPPYDISIHAPHTRSDITSVMHTRKSQNFNPRSSYEERRLSVSERTSEDMISIHAPHARSDRTTCRSASRARYFNPRSSCEERLQSACPISWARIFQSTLLMRGATIVGFVTGFTSAFQSTLLMRGATSPLTSSLSAAYIDRKSVV